MRDARGRWIKGSSGNPAGKPKKTVTHYAEAVMGIKGKRALAKLVKQAALEGTVTFPDGRVLSLDTKEWRDFVEWLFDRLDGKPMQPVQVEATAQVEFTAEDFAEAREELEKWEEERNGSSATQAPTSSSTAT